MKKRQYRLSMAPISTKIYFTLFLTFIGCAFVIGMLNYCDKTKFSYDRTVRYYRGDEDSFTPTPLSKDEEEAEIDMRPGGGMFFKKTYQELIGVTHAHCFSIAIVLFVLSRILSKTRIREGFKITVYGLGFAGLAANLAAPWLITFATPKAVILLSFSNVALIISSAVFVIVPLCEMWLGKKYPLDNEG